MPTRRIPDTHDADDTGETGETGDSWRVPVDRGDLVPTPEEAAELSVADRIRAALQAAPGESVRVQLYRLDPRSRRMQWCEDLTPEQIDAGAHELVRDTWGAGDYEVRAYGKKGILARSQISIAGRSQSAAPAPAPAVDSQMAQILGLLVKGQQDLQQTLATLANKPPAPAPSMKDMLEQMALMKSIIAPAPAPGAQSQSEMLRDMVQTIKTLKEVSGEVAPEKDVDPDNPMALAGSLIELVKTGMASRQQNAALPAPEITVPQSLAEQPPESDDMIKLIFKGAASQLIKMAQAGDDPKAGGEFIYKSLPDDFVPMLALPNWFEIVSHHAPELAQHQAWVEAAKSHADTLFDSQS